VNLSFYSSLSFDANLVTYNRESRRVEFRINQWDTFDKAGSGKSE
jgi:hypothetical protein